MLVDQTVDYSKIAYLANTNIWPSNEPLKVILLHKWTVLFYFSIQSVTN